MSLDACVKHFAAEKIIVGDATATEEEYECILLFDPTRDFIIQKISIYVTEAVDTSGLVLNVGTFEDPDAYVNDWIPGATAALHSTDTVVPSDTVGGVLPIRHPAGALLVAGHDQVTSAAGQCILSVEGVWEDKAISKAKFS
jgi:hypothetical protein